jgi:stage III sporulation protein AE
MMLLALLAVLTAAGPVLAAAGGLEERLPELEIREIEDFLSELHRQTRGYAPLPSWGELLWALLRGEQPLDLGALGRGVLHYFAGELWQGSRLLAQLLVLVVVCALLENLHAALAGDGAGRVAYLACYLALVAIAISSLGAAMGLAREVVERLELLMKAILPVLIPLLAASGAPASAAMLHPVMVTAVYAVASVVTQVVFPVLQLAAVLDLVGHLSPRFRITGMVELLRQLALGALGLALTLFCGIVAVQRAAAGVADTLTVRTAKYVSSTFIPLVGKLFADTVEMLYVSSSALRSVLGIAGAVVIFVSVTFPITKLVALIFIYRLAAALAQPVGGETVVSCLRSISASLVMAAVSVAAVALMFVVSLAMVTSAARPWP